MNKGAILTIALSAISALFAAAADPGTYNFEFSPESHLAKGKWVKIFVKESGMYQLSHDELRQMGFENPEKVAVFGIGGTQRGVNFANYLGRRIYDDNPEQTPSFHTDTKLIFYGRGTADLEPNPYASSFYYQRPQKNIYSDTGIYLLTDSQPAPELPVKKVSSKDNATLLDYGFDYIYHEKDISYKTEGGGQLYWGENLVNPGSLQFCRTGKYVHFKEDEQYPGMGYNAVRGYLLMDVIIKKDQAKAALEITSDGCAISYALNDRDSGKHTIQNSRISIPESGEMKLKMSCPNPSDNFAFLDYYSVTYPKSFSIAAADSTFGSERYGFLLGRNEVAKFPVPHDAMVWDVSQGEPKASLEVEDGFAYTEGWATHMLMVFRPDAELMHPEAQYAPMPNVNLHALQSEPHDMAIITVPYLLPYARQIAELHEKYDGYRVVVATQEELFNEFSCGVPDPMAYRAFLKMLYQSGEGRFKNALLLGPLYADFRNVTGGGFARPEGLIALQQPAFDLEDNPGKPSMDFYGCMSDYVSNTLQFEYAPMELGIGFLPVKTAQEAALAVGKIREYLETEDFSWLVNESMTISCSGDAHAHDNQATAFAHIMQDIYTRQHDSYPVNSMVWLEGLEPLVARRSISRAFEEGKLISAYYGHAGNDNLASTYTTSDFAGLQNRQTGFMFMAGCDLAMPDMGRYGIGTAPVLTARRGLMGTIFATRSVLSNFNQNLCEAFLYGLYTKRDRTSRTETPTIGEAYAYAKDYVANNSEVCYMLCGDPALRVPVALGKIRVSAPDGHYRAGDLIPVEGEVVDAGGKVMTDYNGYATVKMMAPSMTRVIDNVNTPTKQKPIYPAEYGDYRLAAVKVNVKNGRFSAMLPMEPQAESFLPAEGGVSKFQIFAGAYNPSTRFAASGYEIVEMTASADSDAASPLRDEEAPTAMLSYDSELNTLRISAADNVGIVPGIGAGCGLQLSIDGQRITKIDQAASPAGVQMVEELVALGRYDDGVHTATLVASDMQGNTAQPVQLEFTIASPAPLLLNADSNVAVDFLSFTLSQDGAGLEIVVTDFDGNVIARGDADGRSFGVDLKGVKAGTYRAAVRHNSARGATLRSNWVTFSVID